MKSSAISTGRHFVFFRKLRIMLPNSRFSFRRKYFKNKLKRMKRRKKRKKIP